MIAQATKPIQDLEQERPEWAPWLLVIDQVLREARNRSWEEWVPTLPPTDASAPLFANATIQIPHDRLHRWVNRVIGAAASIRTSPMAKLGELLHGCEPDELFRVALCQDLAAGQILALDLDIDDQSFWGVVALLPIPLLQAARRQRAAADEEQWSNGYCWICGAWPAFAEVRGIERSRHLRCGRCGADWRRHPLHCPFCDNDDHHQLVTLTPQDARSTKSVDACKRCRGYLKSFTLLQGVDSEDVMIADLTSVAFDIAALEQGYRRPEAAGFTLSATIEAAQQRKFFWSASK